MARAPIASFDTAGPASASSPFEADWFHYQEGVDVGWGCVWRSLQNVLFALMPPPRNRSKIPDLFQVMDSLQKPQDYNRVHFGQPRYWGEPSLAARASVVGEILPSCRVRCFYYGYNDYMFSKSPQTDYHAIDKTGVGHLWNQLLMTHTAILIDDGTFASAIVYEPGHVPFVVDPHSTVAPTIRPISSANKLEELLARGTMMAIFTTGKRCYESVEPILGARVALRDDAKHPASSDAPGEASENASDE